MTKIEDAVVDYYKALDNQNDSKKICLRDFYEKWLEYKQLHTNSSSYIRRIDDGWNRYYNMSIIMRQSLDLAVRKKIISSNIFSEVKMDSKLFKSSKKADDKKQVFLTDEQPIIEEEAYKDFTENCHKSSAPLAIPLLFQLGCRLGELVALKVTDIQGNYIHIQRQEVKEERKNVDGKWLPARKIVVEYTKSEAGDRKVFLSSKAKEIIKKILDNNVEQGYSD